MVKTPDEIRADLALVYVANDTGAIAAADVKGSFDDVVDLTEEIANSVAVAGIGSGYFTVINDDQTIPPSTPATGDRYLLGAVPTGIWAAHPLAIAQWSGSVWLFVDPLEGFKSYNQSDNTEYLFNGIAWIVAPSGVVDHGALSGLSDDDHSQYHNDARGDLRYDALNAAAVAVAGHVAASDPHTQYLTENEGNALYASSGAVLLLKEEHSSVPDGLVIADSLGIVLDYSEPGLVKFQLVNSGGEPTTTSSDFEPSVRIMTVLADGNITLSGLQTIQTLLMNDGERILIGANSDPKQNLIYIMRAGAWERAEGWENTDTVTSGRIVPVEEGTLAGHTVQLQTPNPITIGTTHMIWTDTKVFVSNFTVTRHQANPTLTLAFSHTHLLLNKNGTQQALIPSFATNPHTVGTRIIIQKTGNNDKTIACVGVGVKLNDVANGTYVLTTMFDAVMLVNIKKNEWVTLKMLSGGGAGSLPDGDYGQFTVAGGVATIDNGTLTLAQMADMATASFIGRAAAGTGVPEILGAATAKTLLGLAGSNSGDQLDFKHIAIATQSTVTALSVGDTLTLVAGPGLSFGTDAAARTIVFSADTSALTSEIAQDAVGAMIDGTLVYVDTTPSLKRAALTGAITAAEGSNATALGSFTTAELNTALSDANIETSGTAAAAVATHVGLADPHTQYALESALGTLAAQNGTFSGISSGTNTGDQTITLSGPITGSGTDSFTTTITDDAVTNTKLANMATATFKGRTTAGTGDPEDLSVAQAKTLLDLTGTNSGDQLVFTTIAVSGQSNVVADAATDTLTLAAGANVTITTNASTDTITIAASSSGTSDPTSAFSAHKNGSAQNFTTATATKLTWGTELFDVGSEFASSTFTPVNSGKYLFECAARVTAMGTGTTAMRLHLYKNGSLFQTLMHVIALAGLTDITLEGSTILAATAADTYDAYVEFVGLTAGTATIDGAASATFFSAARLAVGAGDVVGPASVTDGNFVAFDGTSGKLLKQQTSAQAHTFLSTDGEVLPTAAKTGNYTATAADALIKCDTSGGAFTITLPAAASHSGRKYTIKKTNIELNVLTIDGNSSEAIDSALTIKLLYRYESVVIQCDGSNWQVVESHYVEHLMFAISDEATALTTGTAKLTWRLGGRDFRYVGAYASINTVSSSGLPTFDVNDDGTSIFGANKLAIDASEKTTSTAATAVTIAEAVIVADSEITFDIDVAGTGAKGAKVAVVGYWV